VRKLNLVFIAALVFSLAVGLMTGGCAPEEKSSLRVVTSTSLIVQIVERIGGDLVEVVNIIPPAQCPGHFDVKPGDIQKLADADLFLMHGWQGEMFSQALINSANNPDLTVVVLNVQVGENANWMTPSVQMSAVDKIAAALSQLDEKNSVNYEEAAAEYKNTITAKGAEIITRLARENLGDVNVMCADQQADFVGWTGLNIVSVYGRPDTMTPQVVKGLVDKGREENVTLIIENMQSGEDAGAGLAEELGCRRIILSNFPGGYADTETWEKAIDYNVELILSVIGR